MANIVEGIQDEMNRCRELIKRYEEIGPAGAFGKTMIEQTIKRAEKAIATGDVIEMLRVYDALQKHE
jgi:hypothetical protein